MAHLPNLIIDLALILGAAAIITLVFKWLKQPLVLGYIIAGFLVASPGGPGTADLRAELDRSCTTVDAGPASLAEAFVAALPAGVGPATP